MAKHIVNQYTKMDPTLPRVTHINCPNVNCSSNDDNSKGLSKMSIDITKAMIRKLASQGETFSMSIFRSLKATYYREALDFVQIYKKDALMNKYEIDGRWSRITFRVE